MVEPKNKLNYRPGITGNFWIDVLFIYFTGMGFWTVIFWCMAEKFIPMESIFEQANFFMVPITLAWVFIYLVHKAFIWLGGSDRNRENKN